ncbi:MAG: hypothetical protein IJF71_01160 [Clostridia bacterium]|nr:hypothetical protein [Clostridia bacterium]
MKTKTVTYAAVSAALILVAYTLDAWISRIGLPVRIAVLTLLVMLTLCISSEKWQLAVWVSTFFGITSFLYAWLLPDFVNMNGVWTSNFRNPLISVAPRVCIGFTAFFSYKGFCRLLPQKGWLAAALAAAVGVLTNTLLVCTMLGVFGSGDVFQKIAVTIISVNFVIEIAVNVLCVPVLVKGLKRARIFQR